MLKVLSSTPCHPHLTTRFRSRPAEAGQEAEEKGEQAPSPFDRLMEQWLKAMVSLDGRLEQHEGVTEQDVQEFFKVGHVTASQP
jgi:hypothetical protein